MLTMNAAILRMKSQPGQAWSEAAAWYRARTNSADYASLQRCIKNRRREGKLRPGFTTRDLAALFGLVDRIIDPKGPMHGKPWGPSIFLL